MSDEKTVDEVLTPPFLASFVHVFEPAAMKGQPDDKKKYSVQAVFPKGTNLKALEELAERALVEAFGANKKKWPAGLMRPFRDGNTKPKYDNYKDTIFVNLSSKYKPGIVDKNRQDIIDPEELYSGCKARAKVNAYTFDFMGKAGVSFGLQSIQKLADGERLGGRRNAADDFPDDLDIDAMQADVKRMDDEEADDAF